MMMDKTQKLCKKIMDSWDDLCKDEMILESYAKQLKYAFFGGPDLKKILELSVKEILLMGEKVSSHFKTKNPDVDNAIGDIGWFAFTESDDATYEMCFKKI